MSNRGKLYQFLKTIDERYLRPFFIYEYDISEAKIKDDFLDIFINEGSRMEDLYVNNTKKEM